MYATRSVLTVLLLVLFFGPASGRDYEYYSKKFKISKENLDVYLDIDAAEVEVSAGNGSTLSVEAEYTKRNFKIDTEFDEKRSRLLINFDKDSWNDDDKHNHARVVVKLPNRTKIALQAKIKAGAIDMDFGDLSISELELTTWAGEVNVDFSSVNQVEMSYLRINTKIGDTKIKHLGNARFEEAEIDGGIGEMSVDFEGKMNDGALVDIDLDIGETNLDLPEDLGVRLSISEFLFLSDTDVPAKFEKSGKYYYSRNYESSDRSFEIRVSQGIGSLQFR